MPKDHQSSLLICNQSNIGKKTAREYKVFDTCLSWPQQRSVTPALHFVHDKSSVRSNI